MTISVMETLLLKHNRRVKQRQQKTYCRSTILGELGHRKAPEYRTVALLCRVC